VPASHVALCDSQGNLKDPLDAARFGAQSTPDDDDNNGGNGDVGDGKKRGGWRERIERKRQEMVSRRIERERSRLSGDTSKPPSARPCSMRKAATSAPFTPTEPEQKVFNPPPPSHRC
jgi:hypothetical protein